MFITWVPKAEKVRGSSPGDTVLPAPKKLRAGEKQLNVYVKVKVAIWYRAYGFCSVLVMQDVMRIQRERIVGVTVAGVEWSWCKEILSIGAGTTNQWTWVKVRPEEQNGSGGGCHSCLGSCFFPTWDLVLPEMGTAVILDGSQNTYSVLVSFCLSFFFLNFLFKQA